LDVFNTSDAEVFRSSDSIALGSSGCRTLRAMFERVPVTIIRVLSPSVGLALALALALGGCGSGASRSSTGSTTSASGSGFEGAALPAGVAASRFTLRDQSGSRVSLSSYRGRVVVVAFLYSTCGSPCVVIAQQIRGAIDELGRSVPVLVISADPAADTPGSVLRFLRHVSLAGRVRWLSGSPAQLRPLWRAFRVPPASAGRAAFARSASVFLIDRQGMERVVFQLEQLTPEALSHDLRKLLE
jgi:protein SCO1